MTARKVRRIARHSTSLGCPPWGCAETFGTARHSVTPLDVFPLLTGGFSAVPAVAAHLGKAPGAVTAAEVCRRCRSLRTGTRHTPHTWGPRPAHDADSDRSDTRRAHARPEVTTDERC